MDSTAFEAMKAQLAEIAARLAASEAGSAARLAAVEAENVALRAALQQASEAAPRRPPAAASWRAAPTFMGVAAALGPQLSSIKFPSTASGASIVGRFAELSF